MAGGPQRSRNQTPALPDSDPGSSAALENGDRQFTRKSMILYKYLKPERLEPIQGNTFRFTQPNQCNDPWECRCSFKIGDTPEEIGREFERAHQTYGPTSATGAQWEEMALQTTHDRRELEIQEMMQNCHSGKFGILCFSKNPKKLLMWSHYASDHKGCAIGIEGEHAWFCDPTPSTHLGILRPVSYNQTPPVITRRNLEDLEYLFKKGKDWEYEGEFRYILPLTKYCEEHPQGIFSRHFPPELIKEVIFGYRMDPEVEEKIRRALQGRSVTYFRAVPSSVSYDMELEAV